MSYLCIELVVVEWKISQNRTTTMQRLSVYYFAPDWWATYCDRHVCLSVCLSVRLHISKTAHPNFTIFSVHVTCDRGSILLWRHCNMLLLARLMDQYCFARWRRLSVVVICNAVGGRAGRARGRLAAAGPGAWGPTMHGGPVRLRHVRAIPCYYLFC